VITNEKRKLKRKKKIDKDKKNKALLRDYEHDDNKEEYMGRTKVIVK